MSKKISIVVPVLNEAGFISNMLACLQPFRARGHEVIVVDGGSSDATRARALPYADRLLDSEAGRARQMNAGAAIASGDIIWFLHADTLIAGPADRAILDAFGVLPQPVWGRFDIRLSGGQWPFRVIEQLMNLRSRWSGICTGDQGILVRRDVFETMGGYAEIPLMEDIEFCKRLKRLARPVCPAQTLTTSSRRWEEKGIVRTVLLMWYLRLAYFLGRSPGRLSSVYHQSSS